MASSAQWTNVSDALSKAIRQYQTSSVTLETNTVLMSQEVFALLADWKGKAPLAFTDSQQQAARDAYRVATALMDAAYIMLSLLSTIQTNEPVITQYQTISSFTIDSPELTTLTTQYNAAMVAIQQQSNALGVHLSTVAQNLGTTCSTGKESLPPGQVDGVSNFFDGNGKVVLVSQATDEQKKKEKTLWQKIAGRWNECVAKGPNDPKEKKAWYLIVALTVAAGLTSLVGNSYVALGTPTFGLPYINALSTNKGVQIGGSNFAQGMAGVATTVISSLLGCLSFGVGWKTLLIPLFAPVIGGLGIGPLWADVIAPNIFPPPTLPLEPSQAQQVANMAEIQRELNDPKTPAAIKGFLKTQYQEDVNTYYKDFSAYPPGYNPNPTPTPTPPVTPTPTPTPTPTRYPYK